MRHKVCIMDSNILFCLLEVPGKETVGNGDIWTKEVIEEKIKEVEVNGYSISIPLPMMVEVSNVIGHDKFQNSANKLVALLEKTFDSKAPWMAFKDQKWFWEEEKLKFLLMEWKNHVYSGMGLGDFMILLLKEYYKDRDFQVEIWSGDGALVSYQDVPILQQQTSRRKSRH